MVTAMPSPAFHGGLQMRELGHPVGIVTGSKSGLKFLYWQRIWAECCLLKWLWINTPMRSTVLTVNLFCTLQLWISTTRHRLVEHRMQMWQRLTFTSRKDCKTWSTFCFTTNKGQIKPKAVWARRKLSQKTNEQICFVCQEKQKSKQNKFVRSFFGRIYGSSICFRSYLTFTSYRSHFTAYVFLFRM